MGAFIYRVVSTKERAISHVTVIEYMCFVCNSSAAAMAAGVSSF